MQIDDSRIGNYMIGVGCVMEHAPTGEILCLLRDNTDYQTGEWELMYGRIDQHEELFDALRREVEEETGLRGFNINRLLRVWHIYRGQKADAGKEVHGFTFHCTIENKEVTLSDEHKAYRWVKPEEALELIKVEGIRQDVKFFIENRANKNLAFSGVRNSIDHVL